MPEERHGTAMTYMHGTVPKWRRSVSTVAIITSESVQSSNYQISFMKQHGSFAVAALFVLASVERVIKQRMTAATR